MKNEYVLRNIYIDKIKPFVDKNLIKIITGQRRVGKSYLLYQVIDYIKQINQNANIIFIDKEKYEFDTIRTYEDLIRYCDSQISNQNKNYVFIDEVQDIENFEKALRHYYSNPNIDIYCTGSNEKLLSGEISTVLSGRYIEIKVFSLAFAEFLQFFNLKNNSESLKKYLKIGGLPYLFNLKQTDEVLYEYLKNILSTIIYKDIIARYKIRNPLFLESLVKFLANNTGNLISAKKISDYLKSQNVRMSPQLVLDYIFYLENAFLIFKVKRTDIKGKKIFDTKHKYYFEDIGIKNAITGFERIQINQVIENVIFNHLKIAGYNVYVGQWDDKEIDFVCEKNGNRIYIQAAYLLPDENVIKREFGNLEKIKDSYKKIVVSLDEFAPKNIRGIEHWHLGDFLINILE